MKKLSISLFLLMIAAGVFGQADAWQVHYTKIYRNALTD
jgi:hypothetical protein